MAWSFIPTAKVVYNQIKRLDFPLYWNKSHINDMSYNLNAQSFLPLEAWKKARSLSAILN